MSTVRADKGALSGLRTGTKIPAIFAAAAVLICLLLSGCHSENEVRVFCYGDYMDPKVPEMFEEETGISVVLDTFDTNEEMYPRIKNRAGVYDVVCASDYMAEKMKIEGLLQKIDTETMEHFVNIDDRYLAMADATYDPGNRYAVPYQWGTLGIMYNSRKLGKGAITSWNDLWDPRYSKAVIMQDSLRDTMAVSLLSLGYSLNTQDEKELEKAAKKLIEQKEMVYKYANDSARDLLIGESADLGVVWNGEVLYSRELNGDLDFVVPKEGTEVFVDNWVIPKNAFHRENAEKFIDFMCRPDVALINYEYLTYSTPNKAARDMMEESEKNSPYLFPDEEALAKSESLRDIGPKGDELYSRYWKMFKAE